MDSPSLGPEGSGQRFGQVELRQYPCPALRRHLPGGLPHDIEGLLRIPVGPDISIALPDGYVAFVVPRSGLAAKHGITIVNSPGTVDAGYRGEIRVTVLNTDAEGRIILSDALFYAQRYAPAAIVELSTLTGAVIIALGAHATGMMATDQALADKLSRAGNASSERVWQLPLWEEYHAMVKSEIADLKNIGGRAAGSITAGAITSQVMQQTDKALLDVDEHSELAHA